MPWKEDDLFFFYQRIQPKPNLAPKNIIFSIFISRKTKLSSTVKDEGEASRTSQFSLIAPKMGLLAYLCTILSILPASQSIHEKKHETEFNHSAPTEHRWHFDQSPVTGFTLPGKKQQQQQAQCNARVIASTVCVTRLAPLQSAHKAGRAASHVRAWAQRSERGAHRSAPRSLNPRVVLLGKSSVTRRRSISG